MTPEENRRRVAQARCRPSEAMFKKGNQKTEPISAQDMIYAAKMHRPGKRKPSGRSARSHLKARKRTA